MSDFPKDFLWGAATSSHQTEGNNINNDWWDAEQKGRVGYKSGLACRHYEFYKEDFNLARQLGHNAHRFSVEWSRIQTKEDYFNIEEIGHYLDVVKTLKGQGLEPVVTLHHFTNPLWFAELGGWENKKSSAYFSSYVEKIVSHLCPYVRYWVTVNEPLIYVYHAYLIGTWPPHQKSIYKAKKVTRNLALAHLKAYALIKKIYAEKGLGPVHISIAKNMRYFVPASRNPFHYLTSSLKDYFFNWRLLNYLSRHKSLDFIGVNYYTAEFIPENNMKFKNIRRNNLGWPIYPDGLLCLLLRLKRYNLPVFILENGISTNDDRERWDFISAHLKILSRALRQGTDIIGYIHWSLIDNFEWDKGFAPRFGLIEVDYGNYRRSLRESARKFAEVCNAGDLKE